VHHDACTVAKERDRDTGDTFPADMRASQLQGSHVLIVIPKEPDGVNRDTQEPAGKLDPSI